MLVDFKLKNVAQKMKYLNFKVIFSSNRNNSILLVSFGFLNSSNIQRRITRTFKVQLILLNECNFLCHSSNRKLSKWVKYRKRYKNIKQSNCKTIKHEIWKSFKKWDRTCKTKHHDEGESEISCVESIFRSKKSERFFLSIVHIKN